jgi:hypothetical protein
MRKIYWSLLAVVTLVGPTHANYQKGSQTVSLNFGGAGYSDNFDINNGDNRLRKGGGAGGLQYLYFVHGGPAVAIGPGIQWTDFSDDSASPLSSGGQINAQDHTAIYQLLAKLAFPRGHFRPYLLGGVGAARSSLQSSTADNRPTFDSIKYGVAGSWGLGFDFFPIEPLFLSLELRTTYLARMLHEPTSFGQSQGLDSVRDPKAISMLLFTIGYKFGPR